jgi:hypothetical protein
MSTPDAVRLGGLILGTLVAVLVWGILSWRDRRRKDRE